MSISSGVSGTGRAAAANSSSASAGIVRRSEGSPYVDLDRAAWSALRERTPLPLSAEEVERLRGLGDMIDLNEVREMYLPISRLLNLYVAAVHGLRGALDTFLGAGADD